MESKTLYRSRTDRIIAGVCGGIGNYFDIDPTLVRLLFIIVAIWGGFGVVLYIVCWILIPEAGTSTDHSLKKPGKKIKEIAHDVEDDFRGRNIRGIRAAEIVGLIILLFGILFLLKNIFSFFHWLNADYFWPIILIVVGIFLIATAEKNRGGK